MIQIYMASHECLKVCGWSDACMSAIYIILGLTHRTHECEYILAEENEAFIIYDAY